MKKSTYNMLVCCLCLFTLFMASTLAVAKKTDKPVYVIPISGKIDPGMHTYIKRAISDIPEEPARLIIFEMDTFGGRVDSALAIVETILSIKNAGTIAYVKTKAISAGALISLACKTLVMKPGTTIGDCAPITFSSDGPKMLGEKFQSPLRAKFRSLARINGYNATLAEAMVTKELEIFQVTIDGDVHYYQTKEFEELPEKTKKSVTAKKTVVKKGELLTMDSKEALSLGFSSQSAASIERYLNSLNLPGYTITRIEKKLSEKLLILLISMAPILLAIGIGAVFTEIKAPGFGVPGILGIICLTLAIGSQYAAGMAGLTEILLVVLGFVLIGFEFFVIPGFGLAGISGFLFITTGLILALQGFTLPDPKLPWQSDILISNITTVMLSMAGSIVVAIFFLKYILPKTGRIVKGPYLEATLKSSHADSRSTQKVQPGLLGVADTYLRPSGRMVTENDVFDVITEGEFIEKGTEIIVLAIRGNTIIVQRKNPEDISQ